MRPPIVINDSPCFENAGDVRVYSSVERAERSLEHWDASDPSIHALDAEGRVLRVVSRGVTKFPRLEHEQGTPMRPDALASILTEFLSGIVALPFETKSLNDLLATALAHSDNPYSGNNDTDS